MNSILTRLLTREGWAEYTLTRCLLIHLGSELATWTMRMFVPHGDIPFAREIFVFVQTGFNVILLLVVLGVLLQHKIASCCPQLQHEAAWRPTLTTNAVRSFRFSSLHVADRNLGTTLPIVLTLLFLVGTVVGDLLIMLLDADTKQRVGSTALICQVVLDASGYLLQFLFWATEPDHTKHFVGEDPKLRALMKLCGVLNLVFFFSIQAVKVPKFFAKTGESPWEKTQDLMESCLIFAVLYLSFSFWQALGHTDVSLCEMAGWLLRCCPRRHQRTEPEQPDEHLPLLLSRPAPRPRPQAAPLPRPTVPPSAAAQQQSAALWQATPRSGGNTAETTLPVHGSSMGDSTI